MEPRAYPERLWAAIEDDPKRPRRIVKEREEPLATRMAEIFGQSMRKDPPEEFHVGTEVLLTKESEDKETEQGALALARLQTREHRRPNARLEVRERKAGLKARVTDVPT